MGKKFGSKSRAKAGAKKKTHDESGNL